MIRLRPSAVLFDMDGVLVRSEEAWFRLVEEAGVRFRGRPVSREEFFPTFGQGTSADVEVFGLCCTPEALDAFYVEHFARHTEHVWVDPMAKPMLEVLGGLGVARAVVTNTVTQLALEILEAAGLRSALDVVCGADQVKDGKPAPDLVLHALAKLEVAAERAWMVGDSRFDRAAAMAAKVRFLGLRIEGDDTLSSLSQLEERLAV